VSHLFSIAPAIAQTPALCPAQLPSAIERVANRLPQGRWGILVETLGPNPQVLAARNPDQPLIPASNTKILTTAAALQQLGAAYQIRTTVSGTRSPTGAPTDWATLRITGRGDPSLTTANLTRLAQQLNQAGVRRVAQLIGDDTYFRGAAVNPNWDLDDTLAGYGAAVNSLMVNQNAIGLTLFPQRVGQPLRVQWDDPTDRPGWQLNNQSVTVAPSAGEFVDAVRARDRWVISISGQLRAGSEPELVAVSVPNPGNYLVQKFRDQLAAAQVQVQSSTLVRATPAPPGEVELASLNSPPLSQLLVEVNRESNNIYAESLLKTLGRVQTPTNLDATVSGVAAVKSALTPLGVTPDRYTIVDGSGLSDRNRIAATTLIQTLQAMAQSPQAAVYRASLPTAGVNGTLKNRLRNTPAQGRVQAKTGTISGVVGLSGYATPPNYPPVVFSILSNSSAAAATARSAVDEMVLLLMRLRSC
jgi:D-alanyl-D-alanine carboxypeptidase/D-alanyl-D-alanine-endopeptidase (penicillin-binding protein 4)